MDIYFCWPVDRRGAWNILEIPYVLRAKRRWCLFVGVLPVLLLVGPIHCIDGGRWALGRTVRSNRIDR